MNKSKIRKLLLTLVAVFVVMAGAGVIYIAASGASVSVTDIDYENLTLTVKANPEDSRVLFATSKSATIWEEIPGEFDNDRKITMDISWISVSSNYTLYFKGDKSAEPVKVTLPKQNTKFKAVLNPIDNSIKFSNMGDVEMVYWRKSTSSEWKEFKNDPETANRIEGFCTKGITLYFQTGQKKGTGENTGARPSKAVSVKITKRAAAPSVSLNYNTLTFAVKKTMEYKLSDETTWKEINSTTLNLEEAAPNALYEQNSKSENAGEDISIDFRTKATTSKVASQIKTLEIPVQKDTVLDNVVFSYTGSKQCKIVIDKKELDTVDDKTGEKKVLEAASSNNAYEYTVVKDGEVLDIHKAKWTSITSVTTKISSTVAPEKSVIYVRKKATSSDLATNARALNEGKGLEYPDSSKLSGDVELTKIQGVAVEKQFVLVVKNEDTEVSSITFNDVAAGFKASEPVKQADGTYWITVTINDTASIEKISANLSTKMDANITLSNTETISKGVSLYIEKASTVTAEIYTKYVGIPFETEKEETAVSFDVALNEKDKKTADGKNIEVSSITYNGKDIAFTQKVDADKNSISIDIAKDEMDKLPEYLKTVNYGSAISFIIKLNNGESIDNVKAKVVYPVTVSASESSMGISKSSYQSYLDEVKKANELNSDDDANNDVTVTKKYSDPVITYTINSAITAKDSTYYLKSLTWNGANVLDSYTSTNRGGTYKVTVSLEKLVKAASGSANLTLVLSSSESGRDIVVDYGYHITVTE